MISEFFLSLSPQGTYLLLFGLLISGSLGFPPEDATVILGGILAGRGQVDVYIVGLLCYIGAIIGDLIIYSIGRHFGAALFQKEWFKKRVPPHRVSKVRKAIEKRSVSMIFLARHLFYFRTVTFLTCGAVKMRIHKFIISDMLAGLVSVPAMVWLGLFASYHYDTAMEILGRLKFWISIICVLIALAGIWYWKRRQILAATDSVIPDGE